MAERKPSDDKAAFGVYPQMKGRRSRQDPEAAKNVPVDVARGFVAGALGMPGDVESLVRLPYELITGNESPTFLPTSEDIEKRLPFKGDTPVGRAASGLGVLSGGFYTGPGSAARAITAVPKAVKRAGLDFVESISPVNVIKPKGGNWLGGNLMGNIDRNVRGMRPSPDAQKNLERAQASLARHTADPYGQQAIIDAQQAVVDDYAKQVALNNWVESNLGNYVKKQMGTPDDPVRALHEQGITHLGGRMDDLDFAADESLRQRRVEAGFPAEGMGQSEMARRYENLTDDAIFSMRAGDIQAASGAMEESKAALQLLRNKEDEIQRKFNEHVLSKGLSETDLAAFNSMPMKDKAAIIQDPEFQVLQSNYTAKNRQVMSPEYEAGQQNPFIAKLDPETNLYSGYASDAGFDHVIDVLKEDIATGRIRPDQLNKVSMEQAVRRTYEYDQELAKKMADARVSARAELPVYKEYPEGYKWVELNRPGDFAAESEAMGHSVRGYEPPKGHPDWTGDSGDAGSSRYGHGGWEAIKSGKAKVYSLVDSKGQPHVTVEVGRPELKFGMTAGDIDPYRDRLRQQFPDLNEEKLYYKAVDEFTKDQTANLPPRISQIKGKQNAAPKDTYLPYVQDFVKSGQWSDVGDLYNTGLYSAKDVVNIMPENFTMSRNARQLAVGRARQAQDLPDYMTKAEYEAMLQKHAPEDIWNAEKAQRAAEDDELLRQLQPPPEGMKRGGVVVSNNPDTMMLEVNNNKMAGGGLLKGLKTAAKAAKETKATKGTQEVLPAAEREENLQKFIGNSRIRERLYHATPKDFKAFKPGGNDPTLSGPAIWLTPDATKQPAAHNIGGGSRGFVEGTNVMPVYVQARSPLMLDDKLSIEWARDVFADGSREFPDLIHPKTIEELKSSGYDSIIHADPYGNRGGEQEIIMFEPNKIKSAIGNRGTYDIEDPDITKAEGGAIHMQAGGLAKLLRAAPKSKAEIEAIAERMTPQMLGEFVRGDKGTQSVAGKTQKQFAKEKDMTADVRPTKGKGKAPKAVSIEELKDQVMIGIPGDPTIANKTLYGINDMRLDSPSPQHGGPLYGLENDADAFWASGLGAANRVQNLAREAGQQYDMPVLGNYVMMGPESINYAQHFADANLSAINPANMSKGQIEAFNTMVREGFPYVKNKERFQRVFPAFPGIENPSEAYLHFAIDPELRKHFNALMQMPTVTEKFNLPSGTDVRFAITEPDLRNLETGVTGKSIGRMRPEAEDLNLSSHPTYSHDIPGEFMGSSNYPMPYELSFPDTVKAIRENPKQAPHEFGSLKMVGPRQVIDQQMIDEIRQYEEMMKKMTGMQAGGVVKSLAKTEALAKLAKLREEMAPRAEAVKNLIAKDENKYLSDVTPNSLTNAEIEAEIARMKARSQPEVKKAGGGAIDYNTTPDMSDGGGIMQGQPFKHGGKVKMTANRDAMFLELSNKKLKRK